jgi:uncharacterized protein YgiM (DUF1202 family)
MSKSIVTALACLMLASAAAFAAGPSQMSVTVQQTQVRATPSYLGKILVVLAYGDKVTVLDQPANAPKNWVKVSVEAKKIQGWVNLTALTEKEVKVAAGEVEHGASSGEVALAGKGFNEEVEKQYKADGKLDYTWVDKMVQITVAPEDVAAFLQKGGLSTEGGLQ